MCRFVLAEVVFSAKLTSAVSPPFSKNENGGENRATLPNSVFWNLGEAGGGPSLIENIL